MMTRILSTSLGECVESAIAACATGPQMNLWISLETEVPTEDEYIANYREVAHAWQATKRPEGLKFNHGEYIHKHGDALAFLEEELRRKPTSNRACVSLVDSGEIMNSGDGSLPSFLILQAGFQQSSQEVLYLTAYLRALEVVHFLPINLAELVLCAERLASQFPTIKSAHLSILAFRAHLHDGFGGHRIAEIDRVPAKDIATAVRQSMSSRDWSQVANWIIGKLEVESVISTNGLDSLAEEFARLSESASEPLDKATLGVRRVATALQRASDALRGLKDARVRGTHGATIDRLHVKVRESLKEALSALRGLR